MQTRRARVRSLAKVNLDLRVLAKRPDGFHELRTVFQTISLADTIEIAFTPGRRTSVESESTINIPNNLVVLAAEALARAGTVRGKVHLALQKNIPMGSGMGGGSSNAAAVLLALPVLAGKHVSARALVEMAAGLGSDVPFFLYGGACLGIGRGTELYPLPDLTAPGVVVTPGLHVSTPEAYKALKRPQTHPTESLTTGPAPPDTIGFQAFTWSLTQPGSGDNWRRSGANDFESAVFPLYPQLETIKRKLRRLGAEPARMTGSGSALFGLFETREGARRARDAFRNVPAYEITLVSRRQYRAMWRRQLRDHLSTEQTWPPRSRYE